MAEKSKNTNPVTRRRRLRVQNTILIILIIAMATTGLYLIFEPMYVHWMQDRLSQSLLNNFENGDGTIIIDPNAYEVPGEQDYIEEDEEITTTQVETTPVGEVTPTPSPTPVPEKIVIQAIGRIKIPKIDVDLPIAEGATVYNLRYAIGHYIHSVQPGQPGWSIYLGHRSYNYGRMFNRMGEVETGDKIIIETKKYRYTYEVDRIDVVDPDTLFYEFSVPTDEARIMLVTCTPIRIASHRMLVKGILIKTETIG